MGIHAQQKMLIDDAFEMTEPFLVYREELKDVVQIGVIDLMGVPTSRLSLKQHLAVPEGDEIPVIPLEALVLLKLDAGRPQDFADIQAMILHDSDVEQISEYLKTNAPEQMSRFSELINTE